MSEKFVEKLTEAVSRRGILASLSAAGAAFVSGLFGVAYASGDGCVPGTVAVGCCCLCIDPRNCAYNTGACGCQWSWTCETGLPNCRRYTCRECFDFPLPCDANPSSCSNALCSRATYVTIGCY